ncbi:MAG: aminoglycoside phosphotransferase family protein [Thermomicrobia bacterium]|nr:aminoglycoside phosphotransferase family protein [Thermomicrobia bacterium]MCA1725048.1 aminoglycoside phosphotransferase family protein [Thermomicrobia bacterium]
MTGAMRPDAPDLAAIRIIAARIFSTRDDLTVTRVMAGISTFVYRIERGAETFYLRVLPEAGESFAPEAAAHRLLRACGVTVPEVLFVAPYDETVERSVKLTTAIPGCPIGHTPTHPQLPEIMIEAGRDLARINQIPVAGFGWIMRDRPVARRLAAEHPTYRAFIGEYLDAALATLREHLLDADEIATIRTILDRHDCWLDADNAWLAHGDFDVTHIYHENGRYTGIIDFGEMRGTPRWYDLGHFQMHDGETLPTLVLPWLLEGYRAVTPLPDDYERRISFTSLLIAIRALARLLVNNPQSAYRQHYLIATRRDIASLYP